MFILGVAVLANVSEVAPKVPDKNILHKPRSVGAHPIDGIRSFCRTPYFDSGILTAVYAVSMTMYELDSFRVGKVRLSLQRNISRFNDFNRQDDKNESRTEHC